MGWCDSRSLFIDISVLVKIMMLNSDLLDCSLLPFVTFCYFLFLLLNIFQENDKNFLFAPDFSRL